MNRYEIYSAGEIMGNKLVAAKTLKARKAVAKKAGGTAGDIVADRRLGMTLFQMVCAFEDGFHHALDENNIRADQFGEAYKLGLDMSTYNDRYYLEICNKYL